MGNSPENTALCLSKMMKFLCKYNQLLLCAVVLFIQSFGESLARVLWPIYIKGRLDWDSHELAYLETAARVAVILGTVAYPSGILTVFRGSERAAAAGIPLVAGFSCLVGFIEAEHLLAGTTANSKSTTTSKPFSIRHLLHIANILVFLASCATIRVCFQSLATVKVHRKVQARVFSFLGVVTSLGVISGNMFGTRFSFSTAESDDAKAFFPQLSFIREDDAPFLV